jgi:hypothetical protein
VRELVCNYAIARFRPYRETGEFANVGVVLLCPEIAFFDCRFERHKYKRITDFFPELDPNIFKAGLAGFQKELSRVTSSSYQPSQLVLGGEAQAGLAAFKEIVRTRETIFHFGEVATVLALDPKAKLDELFDFHIRRQFATDREYQEVIMRNRLAEFLNKLNLARFYRQNQRVGAEDYSVILPFVHFQGDTPRKALKPLHLDKPSPTDVYRHGDAWISHIRRLRQINCLPKEFLFAVKHPGVGAKSLKAAQEICDELAKQDTITVPFADTERIRNFAQC